MLKELRSLITFLTIIPAGAHEDGLRDVARYMPLFPLIGAFIGLQAGLLGWILLHLLPKLVAGAFILGFLLLITGFHHVDGLMDFGDGLMCQGSAERKIKAMKDKSVGAGGASLAIITLLITILSISELSSTTVIQALIVAEASAKLSMVIVASTGKSAHKGMNTFFIEAMQGTHRWPRLLLSIVLSICIAFPLLRLKGFYTTILAIVTGLIIVKISDRHFRGVTGDVMGAANEISRMLSITMFLALTREI